ETLLLFGEGCLDPVLTPSTYTTNDAVISSESVFIVELSLACANGVQVSWSLPHKQASSGTYQVKFFDEESYSALRKAQRNNEDIDTIKPLFSVNVDHRVIKNVAKFIYKKKFLVFHFVCFGQKL
uniref:Translocon-associated protein subunit delta n=1 Tax=Astyanax mexicanus TaxID=7994 RepID=A0A8B9H0K2_ASTMX